MFLERVRAFRVGSEQDSMIFQQQAVKMLRTRRDATKFDVLFGHAAPTLAAASTHEVASPSEVIKKKRKVVSALRPFDPAGFLLLP
jgi:hypothetical protein